ncbi:hypothetical protein NX801_08085 [Streptomyces sp. LP05-1]|uniref:Uncharacterized protein n=1 Tax=Streptomyces pyxinae TaxID=2970734 RepID=A0ABT2CDY6_9ACTN|nr:hypothetical protein [Streptomyces sp. LP05-1]MCS0635621.1 hypothetical protein [Streptomyces sp. LP05-1]
MYNIDDAARGSGPGPHRSTRTVHARRAFDPDHLDIEDIEDIGELLTAH